MPRRVSIAPKIFFRFIFCFKTLRYKKYVENLKEQLQKLIETAENLIFSFNTHQRIIFHDFLKLGLLCFSTQYNIFLILAITIIINLRPEAFMH